MARPAGAGADRGGLRGLRAPRTGGYQARAALGLCDRLPRALWGRKTEVDAGKRVGVPSGVAEKMKAPERENGELRQANEILRKASACFAQAELDRPFKR